MAVPMRSFLKASINDRSFIVSRNYFDRRFTVVSYEYVGTHFQLHWSEQVVQGNSDSTPRSVIATPPRGRKTAFAFKREQRLQGTLPSSPAAIRRAIFSRGVSAEG